MEVIGKFLAVAMETGAETSVDASAAGGRYRAGLGWQVDKGVGLSIVRLPLHFTRR